MLHQDVGRLHRPDLRKHAPGTTATIRIREQDGTAHATATNTAAGRPALPPPGPHHGLVDLRQRADPLGGCLTASPTADGGYELRVQPPTDRGDSPST
ncbi:hypothetical protein ABZ896_24370 [Streptomyces sp. NPDC047072]|uniref:hypothetical protein n=1 Tax=Streptomyces sp. NPDC047072 TaxID=3154809 RepID=UPI0033F80A57